MSVSDPDLSSSSPPPDCAVQTLGAGVYVHQVLGPCGCLTAFDLAEISRWIAEARRFGIARVEVHDGLRPDLVNDANFIAVYQADQELPSHGLVRRADGYHVWTMPDGENLNVFTTLADALAMMVPIPG